MREVLDAWIERYYARLLDYAKYYTKHLEKDPYDVLHNALEKILRRGIVVPGRSPLIYIQQAIRWEAYRSRRFVFGWKTTEKGEEKYYENEVERIISEVPANRLQLPDQLYDLIQQLSKRQQNVIWKYLQGEAKFPQDQATLQAAFRALRKKAQSSGLGPASTAEGDGQGCV